MYTLGIDIGASKVAAAVVRVRDGKVVRWERIEYRKRDAETLRQTILRCADLVVGNARISRIGVGAPCIFDARHRARACPNIPELRPEEIIQDLRRAYRAPVVMENDVRAAATAEVRFGEGRRIRDFIFLSFGTGIGGAIVINRSIYKGVFGWAGEFGHTIAKIQISKSKFQNHDGKIQNIAEWEKLASAQFLKGRTDRKTLSLFAEHIAIGFLNITYAFAPECIVIGGGLTALWSTRFQGQVREAMKRFSTTSNLPLPKIIRSRLWECGGAIGAGLLIFSKRDMKNIA